jgi:hypothetical protein
LLRGQLIITDLTNSADITETSHKLRSSTISTRVSKVRWKVKWEKEPFTWVRYFVTGHVMQLIDRNKSTGTRA